MAKRLVHLTAFCALAWAMALPGAARADDRTLTIYTYDSFVADWGPWPGADAGF